MPGACGSFCSPLPVSVIADGRAPLPICTNALFFISTVGSDGFWVAESQLNATTLVCPVFVSYSLNVITVFFPWLRPLQSNTPLFPEPHPTVNSHTGDVLCSSSGWRRSSISSPTLICNLLGSFLFL